MPCAGGEERERHPLARQEAYCKKGIELKRRIVKAEEINNENHIRKARLPHSIREIRLERGSLLIILHTLVEKSGNVDRSAGPERFERSRCRAPGKRPSCHRLIAHHHGDRTPCNWRQNACYSGDLNTRDWTFLERLASVPVLHYIEEEVVKDYNVSRYIETTGYHTTFGLGPASIPFR